MPAAATGRRTGERRFSGADILDLIERHCADVGIVTLAPELDGGLALVAAAVRAGDSRVAGTFRRNVR